MLQCARETVPGTATEIAGRRAVSVRNPSLLLGLANHVVCRNNVLAGPWGTLISFTLRGTERKRNGAEEIQMVGLGGQ